MTRGVEDLFQEAIQLPERDRAVLADRLIQTLDRPAEPGVEAAWSEEIARRVAELDAGSVETISWEDVREDLNRSNA
jgi:putative addiction module component (TIGR02574 family)